MQPNHVKPHGALYNMAVRDVKLADAIARAIESIDPKLILFAPDKSELACAGEAHGLQIAPEIFADRNYLNDGWLVPRTRPMHCSMTPIKRPSGYCGCCAKARCVQSKARMWKCEVKRSVFTAIRLARSNSRANCEHGLNAKA